MLQENPEKKIETKKNENRKSKKQKWNKKFYVPNTAMHSEIIGSVINTSGIPHIHTHTYTCSTHMDTH